MARSLSFLVRGCPVVHVPASRTRALSTLTTHTLAARLRKSTCLRLRYAYQATAPDLILKMIMRSGSRQRQRQRGCGIAIRSMGGTSDDSVLSSVDVYTHDLVQPFNYQYTWLNTTDTLLIPDEEVSFLNTYKGGVFQQATSVVSVVGKCNRLRCGMQRDLSFIQIRRHMSSPVPSTRSTVSSTSLDLATQ